MKKIFTLSTLLLVALSLFAQKNPIRRPDWTFKKPTTDKNSTFYYHVEQPIAATEQEARNLALAQAFMQAAMRVGVAIDISEITAAVTQGTNLSVIADRYKIPMSVVCAYPEKRDDGVRYWLLCQIAKRGNILPEYEDFSDCYKFDIYHHIKDSIENSGNDQLRRSNTRAIVASTFIPGMGQMLKKQGGSGAAFLISEVALFGGGTACYFLGQEQLKTMKAAGTSYNSYKEAKDMKGTLDIAMYTCFGVGIAVHIANMVHAWYVKDKHLPISIAFVPAVIPTNELSTPSFATGAGIQVTF